LLRDEAVQKEVADEMAEDRLLFFLSRSRSPDVPEIIFFRWCMLFCTTGRKRSEENATVISAS